MSHYCCKKCDQRYEYCVCSKNNQPKFPEPAKDKSKENMKYTTNDFTADNYKFNSIAGKDNLVSQQDLLEQGELINEESFETFTGLENNEPVEVLDGLVDTYVVLDGMRQKLENLGFDIEEAMYRVAQNNLTKFIDTREQAEDTKRHYLNQGVHTIIEYNQIYQKYAIKNKAGKIMKPVGFKSVDLSDLVPSELRYGFKQRALVCCNCNRCKTI